MKSLVDHEMGHKISALLNTSQDADILGWYNELMDSGKMRESLSEYPAYATKRKGAKIGLEEFIAEAYSECQNNPSPRPVAKKVVERLIELWEGMK